MLKVGDVVKIYQDPVTKQDYEDLATLLAEYRTNENDGFSMWIVEFHDEPESIYTRTIYEGD